jgi:hypothetical protein
MPSLVKIGFSTKDPTLRAKEFDGAALPYPYVVEFDVLVPDPYQVEQAVHAELNERRENKEWFRCSVMDAVSSIRKIAGAAALLENSGQLLAQDIVKVERHGASLTGLTEYSFEELAPEIQSNAAWRVMTSETRMPISVYYGENFKTQEAVVEQAKKDFPSCEFFQAELLLTPAGNLVREYRRIRDECDRENAQHRAEAEREKQLKAAVKRNKGWHERVKKLTDAGYKFKLDDNAIWMESRGIATKIDSTWILDCELNGLGTTRS